jgi:hypothetical protein
MASSGFLCYKSGANLDSYLPSFIWPPTNHRGIAVFIRDVCVARLMPLRMLDTHLLHLEHRITAALLHVTASRSRLVCCSYLPKNVHARVLSRPLNLLIRRRWNAILAWFAWNFSAIAVTVCSMSHSGSSGAIRPGVLMLCVDRFPSLNLH